MKRAAGIFRGSGTDPYGLLFCLRRQHTSCVSGVTVVILFVMKQYVVDELRPLDYEKIQRALNDRFGPPEMGSLYWIPLATEQLSPLQHAHRDCRPFYFAVQLEAGSLACELLVRTRERVRCECMGYATGQQRDWLIALVDRILEENAIVA